MTNEQAARITGKIFALTVQHMADEAKVSADDMLMAIMEGGAARKRFDAFIQIAKEQAPAIAKAVGA